MCGCNVAREPALDAGVITPHMLADLTLFAAFDDAYFLVREGA